MDNITLITLIKQSNCELKGQSSVYLGSFGVDLQWGVHLYECEEPKGVSGQSTYLLHLRVLESDIQPQFVMECYVYDILHMRICLSTVFACADIPKNQRVPMLFPELIGWQNHNAP